MPNLETFYYLKINVLRIIRKWNGCDKLSYRLIDFEVNSLKNNCFSLCATFVSIEKNVAPFKGIFN